MEPGSLPEPEYEMHDQEKDNEIGGYKAKSAPLTVRFWPPYPASDTRQQTIRGDDENLQPLRPS
jgi:hypothetical protein